MEVLSRRQLFVLLIFHTLTNYQEVRAQEADVSAKYRAVRSPGFGSISPHNPKGPIKTGKVSGFVTANGTEFFVEGKPQYFAGTNAYYLAARNLATDDDITTFFQTNAKNGINIVRLFAFVNGFGNENSTKTPDPIQPRAGIYDEASLQRLDFILKTAASYGQRVILTLVNYEDELGGMQWYVNEVLGEGHPKELFYTHPSVKHAFKGYIETILERVNTMTGAKYKDDPVIFSVELANEPHTSDNYEHNLGSQPGNIVRDWVYEMANYVRSIDHNHMISTGEEGYRIDGPNVTDHLTWMNNGTKGVDYSANILSGNISFATVHVYPDNWKVPPNQLGGIFDFVADRARLAHDAGKPFVMEEYGMQTGYTDRQKFLTSLQQAANEADAAATLVWQVYAWPIETQDSYNFDWSQPGNEALRSQIELMKDRTNGLPIVPTVEPAGCHDIPPPSNKSISCPDRAKVLQQCNETWMRGFCRASCGTCVVSAPEPAPECSDIAPPSPQGYTCHQQATLFNKCGESWMASYCNKSCGRCGGSPAVGTPAPIPSTPVNSSLCADVAPDNKYSCFQQAVLFGQCHQPWMKGYCLASCNACPHAVSSPTPTGQSIPPSTSPQALAPPPEAHCTDEAPSKLFSCFQQAVLWKKCNEPWMQDKCNKSCGRCGSPPCTDIPPPSALNYTCHQQAVVFNHCGEAWMGGYCQATCGVCNSTSEAKSLPHPEHHATISTPAPVSAPALAPSPVSDTAPEPQPSVNIGNPFPPTPPTGAPSHEEPLPKFKLPCTDVAPPSKKKYSCLQQAILWKKCGETWMANYCHASCGRCSSAQETVLDFVPAQIQPKAQGSNPADPCLDIAPPLAVAFPCEQQASLWNQCDEPWMAGYCMRSCGRCKPADGVTSSVAHSP